MIFLLPAILLQTAGGNCVQENLVHQLHPFLDLEILQKVTHTWITAPVDNCSELYMGLSLKTILKMQHPEYSTMGSTSYIHVMPLIHDLYWLNQFQLVSD